MPDDADQSDTAEDLNPGSAAGALSGLHARVLNELGLAVSAGDMRPGTVIRIEELGQRYGVSRSVVREVVRVLASMGMVASRRRVGVQVLPATEWNLYDPQVIRWRLASPERIAQLRSLTELRTAVEPEAARLAAERASPSDASDLIGLAGRLWAAGREGDSERFLRLDIEFHRIVLASSGNEMFLKLHGLVAEVLSGRTHYGMMPKYPHQEALQLHVDVAGAIQRSDAETAHDTMLRIMQRAMAEMRELWSAEGVDPRPPQDTDDSQS